jgi:hypothetical protein
MRVMRHPSDLHPFEALELRSLFPGALSSSSLLTSKFKQCNSTAPGPVAQSCKMVLVSKMPIEDPAERQKIYIAVMGVTGAGKSTFISTVTGNDSIEIGEDLRSCQGHILLVAHRILTSYRHDRSCTIHFQARTIRHHFDRYSRIQ